ncbi:unnamed protein product, partial [Ectocarpus sp. 4 AP-2014]
MCFGSWSTTVFRAAMTCAELGFTPICSYPPILFVCSPAFHCVRSRCRQSGGAQALPLSLDRATRDGVGRSCLQCLLRRTPPLKDECSSAIVSNPCGIHDPRASSPPI